MQLELLAAAARLPLPGGSLAVPGRAAELEWAEVVLNAYIQFLYLSAPNHVIV